MAFRGNVFQGQVSNPGIGAGTNVIAQGTNILGGMINQRERNKQAQINALINQGGKLFGDALQAGRNEDLQTQKDTAEMERLELQLPTQNLTRATSLINAGTTLLNDGNPQGQILVDQGRALMNTGGLGLDTQQGSGFTPTPATGQSTPNFQPVDAQEGGDIGVGDEFTTTDTAVNFPGAFSSQQKQADIVQGKTGVAESKTKLSSLQTFEKLANTPDGEPLVNNKGIQFKDLESTPETRSIFNDAQLSAATDPKSITERRVGNLRSFKTGQQLLDSLEKTKAATTDNFVADFRNRVEQEGFNLLGQDFLKQNQLFKMLGADNSELKKVKEAMNMSGVVTSQLGQLARTISGEKGPLREEDMDRIRTLVPTINDGPESFEQKSKIFTGVLLEVIMEEAGRTLDTTTFNKAQEQYERTFNKPYQLGGDGFMSQAGVGTKREVAVSNNNDDAQIEIGGSEQIPFSEMTNADLMGIDETTLPAKDRILLEKELIKRTRQ